MFPNTVGSKTGSKTSSKGESSVSSEAHIFAIPHSESQFSALLE
jgi:hypothetical protein